MRRWFVPLLALAAVNTLRAADAPPRVLAAWAAGPLEARVAFDRPAPASVAKEVVGARIVFGDGVKAGDRFVPPDPSAPPPGGPDAPSRGALRVAAARLDDDGRTLVLATDPHARDATYALHLPDPLGDVAYTLRGVEVTWDDGGNEPKPFWSGWSPTLDSTSVDRLADWARLDRSIKALGRPSRLTMRSLVALPKGKDTILARASRPFELGLGDETAKSEDNDNDAHRAEAATEFGDDPVELTLTVSLDGSGRPSTSSSWRTSGADARRIGPSAFTLPWAPPRVQAAPPSPVPAAFLAGGDPARGSAIFKGEAAKCATCHKVRGEGGDVGPDLSGLVHRDRAWVYRQVNEPSAIIHPDYVPYTVLLRDGRALVGIVRAEGADAIKVTNTEAKATVVPKSEIDELKPSATSIMPVGLLGAVGEPGVRDLIAFLTTPPTGR